MNATPASLTGLAQTYERTNSLEKFDIYKKISYRREAARHFVLLKSLLIYSRSWEITPYGMAYV